MANFPWSRFANGDAFVNGDRPCFQQNCCNHCNELSEASHTSACDHAHECPFHQICNVHTGCLVKVASCAEEARQCARSDFLRTSSAHVAILMSRLGVSKPSSWCRFAKTVMFTCNRAQYGRPSANSCRGGVPFGGMLPNDTHIRTAQGTTNTAWHGRPSVVQLSAQNHRKERQWP